MSWTTENPGRRFLGCRNYRVKSCGFFDWIDVEKNVVEKMREFYSTVQELKAENEERQMLNVGMQQRIHELKQQNEVWEKKYKSTLKKFKYVVVVLIAICMWIWL